MGTTSANSRKHTGESVYSSALRDFSSRAQQATCSLRTYFQLIERLVSTVSRRLVATTSVGIT